MSPTSATQVHNHQRPLNLFMTHRAAKRSGTVIARPSAAPLRRSATKVATVVWLKPKRCSSRNAL